MAIEVNKALNMRRQALDDRNLSTFTVQPFPQLPSAVLARFPELEQWQEEMDRCRRNDLESMRQNLLALMKGAGQKENQV